MRRLSWHRTDSWNSTSLRSRLFTHLFKNNVRQCPSTFTFIPLDKLLIVRRIVEAIQQVC
jgi:hypothetical protein